MMMMYYSAAACLVAEFFFSSLKEIVYHKEKLSQSQLIFVPFHSVMLNAIFWHIYTGIFMLLFELEDLIFLANPVASISFIFPTA